MPGIKETSEALIGVNETALVLIPLLKDGVQLGDFGAFWDKLKNDPVYKAAMEKAYDNFKAIPAEVSDINMNEALSLVTTQIGYIPKLVNAFKGK
jgi:hypothetical protein